MEFVFFNSGMRLNFVYLCLSLGRDEYFYYVHRKKYGLTYWDELQYIFSSGFPSCCQGSGLASHCMWGIFTAGPSS